jgi:hypothetical protein
VLETGEEVDEVSGLGEVSQLVGDGFGDNLQRR